ncbi:MAG: hypothetical protein LBR33_08465 [Propionibacteriaceae bacterium]|jgi:hypothetical protein|nr:hypothetical protein [Propionibacteriaceae bacterium]
MEAGAARAEIAGSDWLPLDGFDRVLDPLSVRTLVVADGPARAALVLVDQTSMTAESVARAKAAVSEVTGVPGESVLVVASHTFSAPHVLPDALVPPGQARASAALARSIDAAVRDAASRAAAGLRPARLRAAVGTCVIGVNRDVETADGWWHGANEAGPRDPALPTLVLDDAARAPLAVVTAVAAQSAILHESHTADGGRVVSADLSGAAARHVEAALPGGVAFVLTGAAGDQAPIVTAVRHLVTPAGAWSTRDAGDAGHLLVDLLGERLGAALLDAVAAARPVGGTGLAVERGTVTLDAQRLPADSRAIRPSRAHRFTPDGTADAPWVALRLGGAVLIGTQAELSAATGLALRAASPCPHTLVATLVDGAAKYMADADAYRRSTYEAMNSRYARGSAERFAAALLAALNAMFGPGGSEAAP